MTTPSTARQVPCEQCPLRALPHLRDFSPEQLAFVSSFKTGELVVAAGAVILSEGTHSAHLFTLLSGWAFRYKTLEDGRRQILNYILPGDLVGLQGSVMGEMQHSVETLAPSVFCIFQRSRLPELFTSHPGLGFDVTWIASREERMLDENLLSLGRRTALERAAYLLAFLGERAAALHARRPSRLRIPITQQHVADTLGLSIVHTNKTLRKLSERGLIHWRDRVCEVLDIDGLKVLAGWEGLPEGPRPFI